jgi:hypothetical protein
MSVTFRAEPNALSFVVYDYHLECCAESRQDVRTFATYQDAIDGIKDHSQHCSDMFCYPDTPYVVPRTPADDEPTLNVTAVNARTLLQALGLVPELGAEAAVLPLGEMPPQLGYGCNELEGICDSTDLLARIDLALALAPADAGVPWHEVDPRVIDCGRWPGYLQDRLAALREVAVYARRAHRRVDWC